MPSSARSKGLAFAAAGVGALVIGWLDYETGVELRIYPLYFAPIGLAAWNVGRVSTIVLAVLCSLIWGGANLLAGLQFSSPFIWAANVMAQSSAFVFVGYLVASLRHALERERGLSRTDSLTKLPNQRAFYEEAARFLARSRRHKRPLSIAYIDVDDFKKVNDTLGHQGGDEVLRAIGEVLARTLRAGDVAARLGGDEFAMLLEETDQNAAKVVLERTRRALADVLESGERRVTTSIGAVTFVEPPADVETLVRKADALMYAAKAGGKDRFHLELVEAAAIPALT